MKPIPTYLKILISLPTFVYASIIAFQYFDPSFAGIFKTMHAYNLANRIILGVNVFISILLVFHIWRINFLSRSTKQMWTFYLVIFNAIALLFLVWYKEKQWLKEYDRMTKGVNKQGKIIQ